MKRVKRVGEIIKMKADSDSRISRFASRKHEVEAHGQQVVGAVGSWFLQARKEVVKLESLLSNPCFSQTRSSLAWPSYCLF